MPSRAPLPLKALGSILTDQPTKRERSKSSWEPSSGRMDEAALETIPEFATQVIGAEGRGR